MTWWQLWLLNSLKESAVASSEIPEGLGNGRSLSTQAVAQIAALISEHEAELIAFRRRLHSEPELSFAEVATTDALMERLSLEGLSPVRLESGTGLYCDVGDFGPMVAVRAEIDALAMNDVKDVPYRSRNDGVTHACGHDVHTAAVLGAGLALKSLADSGLLPGRVRLIFEPGEESVPVGSVEIVEAGLLAEVQMIHALHCDPKQEVGLVGARVGPITSAYDRIELTITGPGGHTARPGLTVDLVSVAARVVDKLPIVLTDLMGGPETTLLVFGSLHTGSAANVIPTRAVLGGSLRTQSREVWTKFPEQLAQAVATVLAGSGAGWELDHVRGVPPVVNDEGAMQIMTQAAQQLIGPDVVTAAEHSWGGDSFGWMTNATAGAFLRLGTHTPGSGDWLDLHHAAFDVDERSIAIGAKVLAGSALLGLPER
jgi:amidohydrolase